MKAKLIQAQIDAISPLTDSIVQLILTPNEFVAYQAGQYLQILLDDEAYSYSIANAPLGSHKYELHIRHSPNNPYTQQLFAYIKEQGSVTLRLPYGECRINNLAEQKPIIFIAGGTGFAPIKAMIEQLLACADARSFELYWGARSQSDLYMDEKVNSWQAHASRFNYFSILADTNKDSLVSNILKKHPEDLDEWQMVISGPFDMVYSTRDILVQHGVSPTHLFSDAFSFESKKEKQ
jgi:CDP-4-dehydro-6-deoxyglucose reductase